MCRRRPAALRRLLAGGLPGRGPPRAHARRGGRLAIVTQSSTPYDSAAAVRLDGDVAEEPRPRSSTTPSTAQTCRSRAEDLAAAQDPLADAERLGDLVGALGDSSPASASSAASAVSRDAPGGPRGPPSGPGPRPPGARRAAPRARPGAEAPPPGGGPGRGRRALAAAASRRRRSAPDRRARPRGAPGAQRLGRGAGGARAGDLDGLLPAPLGQPVAGAVSDPGDENRLAPDLVTVGIVGGDPVGAQHRVDRPQPRRHPAPRPPRGRRAVRWSSRAAPSGSEGSAGITVRRVRGTSGGSAPGSAGRGRRRRGRRPAGRAPERLHDDHGVRLLVGRRRAAGSARHRARGGPGRPAGRRRSGRSPPSQPTAVGGSSASRRGGRRWRASGGACACPRGIE